MSEPNPPRAPMTLDDAGPAWLRGAASWAYGLGRQAHRGAYAAGILARKRLPRPVICAGNLTVGGTGKTPFLIALARALQARGLRPAVLSRGYGAEPAAEAPRIVSDGIKLRCGPIPGGDEPVLIARSCPGVPVVIGSDRYQAGMAAARKFEPDLFLLDDGFQHEALARDADLVLWDLRDAPEEMRLLPAGRLREPLAGLRRAAAIVLTHAEYLPEAERGARRSRTIQELKRAAPAAPIFEAAARLTGYRPLETEDGAPEEPLALGNLRGVRAVLLSGLARPEGFEVFARAEGIDVASHIRRGDHARYGPDILGALRAELAQTGAALVLTTEKDAVKLEALDAAGLPIFVAGLAMTPLEPERWEPFLEGTLARAGLAETPKQ